MQIDYRVGSYRTSGGHDPDVLRRLGWNLVGAEWRTAHLARVLPLEAFCVGEALRRVAPVVAERKAKIAASNATTADVVIPVGTGALAKGYNFRPYQKAGIIYSAARHKSLNADIPRLGKMIMGIGLINTHPVGAIRRGLILSPANAKITWCERWPEWTTHPDLGIDYCEGDRRPDAPILVCNWDILTRHIDYFLSQEWDFVIGDELHRCGREDSARTRATFGSDLDAGIPARLHWLGLTGTPIGTRPINIWPICRFMDRRGLGADKWQFRKKYCGARADNGWDSKGSTNEEELQYKLRASFMVRRDRGDVGADLPPNRQTIRLPAEGLSRLVRAERSALQQNLAEFEALVRRNQGVSSAEYAVLDEPQDAKQLAVQELTLAALPMMTEFINEQLETESKVVVFCHHRAVAKALQSAFPGCAFVIGGMTAVKREAERKRFQEDGGCHVFVGNIAACCENLELSSADVIVFCELIWQTGLLDQAEMRIWLPDKDVPIQIFRLVVAGSATADMADEMERRQQGIERATVARRLAV